MIQCWFCIFILVPRWRRLRVEQHLIEYANHLAHNLRSFFPNLLHQLDARDPNVSRLATDETHTSTSPLYAYFHAATNHNSTSAHLPVVLSWRKFFFCCQIRDTIYISIGQMLWHSRYDRMANDGKTFVMFTSTTNYFIACELTLCCAQNAENLRPEKLLVLSVVITLIRRY